MISVHMTFNSLLFSGIHSKWQCSWYLKINYIINLISTLNCLQFLYNLKLFKKNNARTQNLFFSVFSCVSNGSYKNEDRNVISVQIFFLVSKNFTVLQFLQQRLFLIYVITCFFFCQYLFRILAL